MRIAAVVTCLVLVFFLSPLKVFGQFFSVETRPPDSVSANSAVLRAICYPNGTSIDVSFALGFTTEYELGLLFAGHVQDTVVSAEVRLRTPPLVPYTRYHCRARGTNGTTTYIGQDISFVTIPDSATGGFVVEMDLIDHGGIRIAMPVRFGVHSQATYCIDRSLGEYWLPPVPPQTAIDLRMIDPRGFNGNCMDQGLQLDLRRYIDTTQIDSYKVRFQPTAGGYPIVLTWTPLAGNYSGDVRMFDTFNGTLVNVDMKNQNSLTVTLPLTELMITAERPRTILAMRVDSLSAHLARLMGLFNPGGLVTNGWFEWGLSQLYGDSTTPASLGSGLTPVEFTGTITGIQPETTYYCRALTRNSNGTVRSVGISFRTPVTTSVAPEPAVPKETSLQQNYPNPFNPTTTLSFSLPQSSFVILKVYNILGQEVRTLVNERVDAGVHQVVFDASGLPSGVYLYKIQAGKYLSSRKMVFIK